MAGYKVIATLSKIWSQCFTYISSDSFVALGVAEPFKNIILWVAHKKQGELRWERATRKGKSRDDKLIKAHRFN